jgi:hypothetical protein
MSKERELLERYMGYGLLNDDVYKQLVKETKELLSQPEQFPLPGERLIEMWRDGYDARVRLAQPEQEQLGANMKSKLEKELEADKLEADIRGIG